MIRFLSSAAMLASVVACNGFGHAASSYDAHTTELLEAATQDTWYPACTAHVPFGAHCGMLVATDWKARLDAACHDGAACATDWLERMHDRLESRYGGTAQQTTQTCGTACDNPYVLELAMMKAHNERVDAGYREALHTTDRPALAVRESSSDHEDREAAYRVRVAGAFTAMTVPHASCRESSECPVGTCVLPAGSSNTGICVR